MSPAEIDRLKRNWEWYQSHPSDQTKLSAIHRAVVEKPELKTVVDRYYAWFLELSPSKQRELLELPTAERLDRVAAMRLEEQRFSQAAQALTDNDIVEFIDWAIELAKSNNSSRRAGEMLLRAIGDAPRSPREKLMIFNNMLWRGWLPREFFASVKPEDLQRLNQRLAPETRKKLQEAGEPRAQLQRLQEWLRAIVADEVRLLKAKNQPKPEQLRSLFQSLSAEERDRLEALPPDEMRERLEELYYSQIFRRPFGGGPMVPGAGGPPGPGGPGSFRPGNGRPQRDGSRDGDGKRDGDGNRD